MLCKISLGLSKIWFKALPCRRIGASERFGSNEAKSWGRLCGDFPELQKG